MPIKTSQFAEQLHKVGWFHSIGTNRMQFKTWQTDYNHYSSSQGSVLLSATKLQIYPSGGPRLFGLTTSENMFSQPQWLHSASPVVTSGLLRRCMVMATCVMRRPMNTFYADIASWGSLGTWTNYFYTLWARGLTLWACVAQQLNCWYSESFAHHNNSPDRRQGKTFDEYTWSSIWQWDWHLQYDYLQWEFVLLCVSC